MNWGKGIIIAMSTFITFIVILIVIMMSNKVDLVSEDYYQKEISFEDDISAKRNFIEKGVKFAFDQNEMHLIANLPELEGVKKFKLVLARPNDSKGDISFDISNTKTFLIEKNKLEKGVYNYRLECENNGKSFLETGKYYLK